MSESDDILLELLGTWLEANEAEEAPPLEDLCASHPELLPRLVDLVEREAELQVLLSGDVESDESQLQERFGPYHLEHVIGEGSMGRVFSAMEQPLRRRVALKVLRPDAHRDPRMRRRFEREARVTAALEHPSIVPIYGVGSEAGRSFMAMKLLEGPALDDKIGELEPLRVAELGAQLARALHEAHLNGVLHRDVKPANILLDRGVAVLVDFGLAKDRADQGATREGTVAGTLLYMAPEQLRGEALLLDGRADVYALGVTLYELLSGSNPFDAADAPAVMQLVLHRDPPRPRLSAQSDDLVTILLRAMEKERSHRFETALSMAEDLERFASGRPILSRRSSIADRSLKLLRRNKVAASFALLALLIAFAALAFGFVSSRERALIDQARLDRAEAALLIGDLHGAGNLIDAARSDSDPDSRFQTLARRLDAAKALRALLDRVFERRLAGDPAQMRALIAALEDQKTEEQALKLWALTLAELRLGTHAAAARRILAAPPILRDRRAGRALLALAEGRDPALALDAELAGTSADDHVFSAAAIDLYRAEEGMISPAVRRELDAAYALDLAHPRARAFEAGLRLRLRQSRIAEALLRGLSRFGRAGAAQLRNLALAALQREAYDEAEKHLESVGHAERDSRWLATRADLVRRRKGAAAAVDWLREKKNAAPSPYLALHAARIALSVEDVDEAQSWLAASSDWPARLDEDRALLRLQIRALGSADEELLSDLEAWGKRRVGPTPATYEVLVYHVANQLGERSRAWNSLRRCLENEGADRSIKLSFLEALARGLVLAPVELEGAESEKGRAFAIAEELLATTRTMRDLGFVCYFAAALALDEQDEERFERYRLRFEALPDEIVTPMLRSAFADLVRRF